MPTCPFFMGSDMKKAIFYDLDGTLVDTRADIANAVNYMLKDLGAETLSQEIIEQYVGHGLHYLLKGCLKTADMKLVDRGAKIYKAYYSEHMLDESGLYPDAHLVLEYLSSRYQSVITNKPNPFTDNILEALNVTSFFKVIIPGNSDYPRKPDPKSVLDFMREFQIEKEEAVFIGDSSIDVETGKNAGIQTAMLTHGFGKKEDLEKAGADNIFDNFKELLKFAKDEKW